MRLLGIKLRDQWGPMAMVLLSFFPLMGLGFILDVGLVLFYSQIGGNSAGLSVFSLWVYNHLAGYRFLAQEFMLCFWLVIVLFFFYTAFRTSDPQQFRLHFLYVFVFLWGTVMTACIGTIYVCIQPFDLLLDRIEDTQSLARTLDAVLLIELAMIFLLPAAFAILKKIKVLKK